ncbi:glutamyl-tRNA reductase [Fluviicola taffensis]|uniref:Glutamyl-tRNA reductase n=1 Tax=Fluviicola taffensis (strain DSM 16823 / NCIMB 13979 / RW262) TaxID=755732 RepID=F2IEC8_FLUTR|nr:glutamyl-tRNA reductase [Fluviicola taffensis]AEA43452.1 Glutamyl-tRNA reductase [Fluviicola taffensis DSM 16823]
MIKELHTIAFTHRNLEVSKIGALHIEKALLQSRFQVLKDSLKINEITFLSTCNRVEYFLVTNEALTDEFLTNFFSILYPDFSAEQVTYFSSNAFIFSKMDAVNHVLRVASSIDSLVIGEREIITQVRQAYEESRDLGLSGDTLRILFRHTIETAKRVYTETKISQKPVSVVSIAYHRLVGMDAPRDARVLAIGAGVTNTAMLRFLKKHGMTNFVIFNRTIEKAELLAEELGGKAYSLNELTSYTGGFDVLVSCTGSQDVIVDEKLYSSLLMDDLRPKFTVDLALPSDISADVHARFSTKNISIEVLQKISEGHLLERSQEVIHVEQILDEANKEFRNIAKMRAIEVAMRPVPQMVKDIRATAFNEIFKNELDQLDQPSLEILEKVVGYMEKKYMSMPMIMAKEIMFKS